MDAEGMGAAKNLIDKKVLRDLIPINALSTTHLDEISRKAIIEDLRSGAYVFRKGDRDYQTVYLLEGQLDIIDESRNVTGRVTAGSEVARHPLMHKQPRQVGARAVGKVTVARVDSSLLDVLLTWDESAGYDVVEIDAQQDDDWMTRMLQSQAFLRLPPSNIQQLLMRLEPVVASAGDVIVRQNDDGDYFYIVKHGRLAVTRKATPQGKDVMLAELSDGACFGEEALVSGTRRNASVTMLTDGTLMRLSKNDFDNLLCASLVHETDVAGAQALVAAGARWLDVRLPGEFDNRAIRDSINVPLSALREHSKELDRDTNYIVCCDTGRRSAAGAFVLSQRGFSVFVLKNGLMDVPDAILTAAPDRAPDETVAVASVAAEDGGGSGSATSDADTIPGAPLDRVLVDRLAAAQSDKLALHQQLAKVREQLDQSQRIAAQAEAREGEYQANLERLQRELEQLGERVGLRERQIERQDAATLQEKASFEEQLAAARSEISSSQQRLQAAEEENAGLQAERTRLQDELSQIRHSAQGQDDAVRSELAQLTSRRETERTAEDRRRRELEAELGRVREDYRQLGQRTSAVAGERDAMARESEQLKQQLAALQDQLSREQNEHRAAVASARQALDEREQSLAAAQAQALTLTQRLEDLDGEYRQAQQQLHAAADASRANQAQLTEFQERLEETEQQRLSLEVALESAGRQVASLQEQLQCAERQTGERLEQQRLEREEMARQLAEVSRQLDAKTEQEQHLREELAALHARGDDDRRELQRRLEQATEALAVIETDLADTREQAEAAAQRNAAQEAQLVTLAQEHRSSLDDTRKALSRAQTETANVQREQGRLMAALRQAEQALENERQEHKNELHRLQREATEASGESGAERESLHQQLAEAGRVRDDLQVKLGERSAQLKEARAAQEKLQVQLQQAQDSARRAEQQLLESNHTANDEMAARIDAEMRTQQALRDELASVIAERNHSREQLTVQLQELDELRLAVEQVRRDAAAEQAGSEERLSQLQQERDAALQRQLEIQQQADQLRAEAEVTRGLVDMQATGDGDAVLRDQLEQAQKNVDVAVRLRARAEEQNAELRADIERLREQLQESVARAAAVSPAASALQTDDLVSGYDESVDTGVPADEQRGEAVASATVFAPSGESGPVRAGGGLKSLLGAMVLGALGAGGGVWWLLGGSTPSIVSRLPIVTVAKPVVHKATGDAFATTDAGRSVGAAPAPTAAPANRPAADTRVVQTTAQAQPPVAPETSTGRTPVNGTDTGMPRLPAEPAPPPLRQPVGSFSEPLSSGGRAPTMVALQADGFDMGSGNSSANFDERPRHHVELRRFAISRHEITFDQYDRFARASGRSLPRDNGWGRGERPVINVSWQDALAYTQWLSEQTGSHYRLPTEAEWEFAARAGSTGRFWWGNELQDSQANCFDCGGEWAGVKTAPVGSFGASPFGLTDTAGNVMEWVQDCYQPDYTSAPVDGSAVGLGDCQRRVVRGGGYDSPSESLRSARRDARDAGARLDNLGFRIVKQ
jgi:formylglycine-generating enzyme required for sulfatase activity/CRP-like cAMP-binding protein/chromosome segregation ATPase